MSLYEHYMSVRLIATIITTLCALSRCGKKRAHDGVLQRVEQKVHFAHESIEPRTTYKVAETERERVTE